MDLTNSLLLLTILPLALGWLLDLILGDPAYLPHPVVGFGKLIAWGDKKLNKGNRRKLKGAILTLSLCIGCFIISYFTLEFLTKISPYLTFAITAIGVFYCLAGKTLCQEVSMVFQATDESVDKGRKQLSRIVGRDTSQLSPQAIRTGALETLAENLSDGVVAPLFWVALLGLPGMLTYKIINTQDSMIAYKNEKYKDFGCWAAHIDDIVNYIPARITALLMLLVSNKLSLIGFVRKYRKNHLSPNSGYPESALAGILDTQFGGPNVYHGKLVEKPFIGENPRSLTTLDMQKALKINRGVEALSVIIILAIYISIL